MASEIRNPHNCGQSINFSDTFICKMSRTPCAMNYCEQLTNVSGTFMCKMFSTQCAIHFDKKCELDNCDSFYGHINKTV